MPYFAIREADSRTVTPSQASGDADLQCRECCDDMHLVQAFERSDGSFVSSHFRHNRGQGNGCGGGSGGESDEHIRMKEIAYDKLIWEFDDLAAAGIDDRFIGDNKPDVWIEFESPETPLGRGLVVEAQHKNETKDIDAVTQNFIQEGFTVLWLWEDQFHDRDVDLFGGDVVRVWPNAVPNSDEWMADVDDEERYDITQLAPYRLEPLDVPDYELVTLPDGTTTAQEGDDVELFDRDHHARAMADDIYGVNLLRLPSKETRVSMPVEFYEESAQKWYREMPWSYLSPSRRYLKSDPDITGMNLDVMDEEGPYAENYYLSDIRENPAAKIELNGWDWLPVGKILYWYQNGFRSTENYHKHLPPVEKWTGPGDIEFRYSSPELEVQFPSELVWQHEDYLKAGWRMYFESDFDVLRTLSDNNATRRCTDCGGQADYYIYTADAVSKFICESCLG